MGKILIIADKGDSCVATSRGLELAAKLGMDAEVAAFIYAPLDSAGKARNDQASLKQKLLDARRAQVQDPYRSLRRAGAEGGAQGRLAQGYTYLDHPSRDQR
jgi:hypothetical protein